MSEKKIRVLIAKPGLDGHDRGAKVVARALRDAGFEVIYTGLRQTPEQIVEAAVSEDVDAVGLSLLSGAHNYLFPRVIELLKEQEADGILVFGGGVISVNSARDMPSIPRTTVEKRIQISQNRPKAIVAIESVSAIRFLKRRFACILRRDSAS